MSKIIVKGSYPENNKIECEECHCLFAFYDSEIIHQTSTPLEMDTFGGWGYTNYVICPQCKHKITLKTEFFKDPPLFEGLINGIKKIFGLNKNKEGKDNNGKDRNIKSK